MMRPAIDQLKTGGVHRGPANLLSKPWTGWLLVLLGIVAIGAIAWTVLLYREKATAATVVAVVFGVLACAWCYFGLWRVRGRVWAKWLTLYLITGNFTWLLAWWLATMEFFHWSTVLMGVCRHR